MVCRRPGRIQKGHSGGFQLLFVAAASIFSPTGPAPDAQSGTHLPTLAEVGRASQPVAPPTRRPRKAIPPVHSTAAGRSEETGAARGGGVSEIFPNILGKYRVWRSRIRSRFCSRKRSSRRAGIRAALGASATRDQRRPMRHFELPKNSSPRHPRGLQEE